MIKQKKILLVVSACLLLSLSVIKFIDFFLQKKFGLGKPVIYESSRIYGYKIKPNQNITNRFNINNHCNIINNNQPKTILLDKR